MNAKLNNLSLAAVTRLSHLSPIQLCNIVQDLAIQPISDKQIFDALVKQGAWIAQIYTAHGPEIRIVGECANSQIAEAKANYELAFGEVCGQVLRLRKGQLVS